MRKFPQKLKFATTCVASDERSICNMTGRARRITAKTFFSRVNRKDVEEMLGYGKQLHIKDDCHVSYYASRFRGIPCYYLDWSSIEHIFI